MRRLGGRSGGGGGDDGDSDGGDFSSDDDDLWSSDNEKDVCVCGWLVVLCVMLLCPIKVRAIEEEEGEEEEEEEEIIANLFDDSFESVGSSSSVEVSLDRALDEVGHIRCNIFRVSLRLQLGSSYGGGD